ncbi:MAG: sulfurtransferase TusA family protein [Nitrospirae bacterium]|nr:sulfurtransferase TusA family protein [Nitrospirota bacterium]
MENVSIDQSIDARGSACPGPLMELIRAVKSSKVGTVIEVLSSERGSINDVPSWLDKVGQMLIGIEEVTSHWRIVVKKVK